MACTYFCLFDIEQHIECCLPEKRMTLPIDSKVKLTGNDCNRISETDILLLSFVRFYFYFLLNVFRVSKVFLSI